ncbi:EamA family transporter RarD [Vreelandella populi]|uniref:EamA family transporter RarD n=1 Tax=Vreelandella populi TaxID=2498858 RepID=A0A433L7V8_9GAMM|nr:EamA family transporter RarD [Halomonas populi]RUR38597.1 EamA family transporter RarD [Halomonas populi]RUR43310.1 EamA family transporter RarD [Halomonas populi]RUR51669.1 EamA family transporter RarD [Halomonas populi]
MHSTPVRDPQAVKGVTFGLTAYIMWGCFPLFFALFEGIPAFEVLIHRILWSCLFLVGLITLLKRWAPVISALKQPRRLGRVLLCALLIAFNWGLYIYAVESKQVLQASLGYFLTPLINVALGMLVLREVMERLQLVALGLASLAIVIQFAMLGELPWISLLLAFSFGSYGLFRKQVPLDGLSGLFVETLLLFPLALLAITWLGWQGESHFLHDAPMSALLIASGVATALPLLAFAGAARRLRLSTLGFLMYINPTIQFLIALFIFGESLGMIQLATFVMIWLGLALYTWSSWQSRPRQAVT